MGQTDVGARICEALCAAISSPFPLTQHLDPAGGEGDTPISGFLHDWPRLHADVPTRDRWVQPQAVWAAGTPTAQTPPFPEEGWQEGCHVARSHEKMGGHGLRQCSSSRSSISPHPDNSPAPTGEMIHAQIRTATHEGLVMIYMYILQEAREYPR